MLRSMKGVAILRAPVCARARPKRLSRKDLEFDSTRKLEIENKQLKQENETVNRIKTNFETYESRMVELINDALTDPEEFKKKVSEFRKQKDE